MEILTLRKRYSPWRKGTRMAALPFDQKKHPRVVGVDRARFVALEDKGFLAAEKVEEVADGD